ncbi:Mg-dependent DNase [Meredithblackwellia eburnea MCA 4105]
MGSVESPPASSDPAHQEPPRLIDIGSNLSDPVFKGVYRGKRAHDSDWDDIVARARNAGVVGQILTGDCLSGSKESIELCQGQEGLYCTVGCHPCRADEFDTFKGGPDAYLSALSDVIEQHHIKNGGPVVAVGECGLDFDRLEHCSKEVQLKYFPLQLQLATKFDLPLFLHSRNCHAEFVDILSKHPGPLRGVVHSHTGTVEEALQLVKAGFFIGINGCSLKEQMGLDVVTALPLEKLLVESDCPWCEVRPSHASHPILSSLSNSTEYSHLRSLYNPEGAVKKEKWVQGKTVRSRNEPAATGQIAWVISKIKGVPLEQVASTTFQNTLTLFDIKQLK